MQIKPMTRMLLSCVLLCACVQGCSRWSPKVWVQDTQELTIPTTGVSKVAVTTHNGAVKMTGEANRGDMFVIATLKGGGRDQASAEEALAAIEIVSERDANGTYILGHRWSVTRQPDWQASVAFDVTMPTNMTASAKTHNGAVRVAHIDGDCELVSHNGAITADDVRAKCHVETNNGRIRIDAPGATVRAVTHNGAIDAKTGGNSVHLESHNGRIKLDASNATALGGKVCTHNGAVRVVVPTNANAELTCSTNNGSINCNAPMKVSKKTRRLLVGVLGDGSNTFTAETHNGAIRIEEATQ